MSKSINRHIDKSIRQLGHKHIAKKFSALLVIICVLGSVFLVECGKSDQQSNATAANTVEYPSGLNKTVTIRVAEVGWDIFNVLLKAAGLDDTPYTVEYSVFNGGNLTLSAMAADQVDLTNTSEIPPIGVSQAANGGNFKIVAVSNSSPQNQELVVMGNSGIKSVAALKGKRVGYVKNTTAHYFLYRMLKEEGLSWSDITPVEITTADGVTALTSGGIDAFASYGNSINAAKNMGAVTLKSALKILSGNFPFEVSQKVLDDPLKRAAVADFLARIQKGYEWQANHLEKWAEISADPTGLSYEDNLKLLKATYADFATNIKVVDDNIIKSEQSIIDVFNDVGLYTQKVETSTLYDKSFTADYNSALSRLK